MSGEEACRALGIDPAAVPCVKLPTAGLLTYDEAVRRHAAPEPLK